MTKEITVNLPKLGESIHSATIVRWFKKVGDAVALDEPLLEVSTDKVNSEIPSPAAGVIKEILAEVDRELQVGEPLLIIAEQGVGAAPSREKISAPSAEKQAPSTAGMKGFFSPALLRMAQESGISMEELEKIPATGAEGRLTKKDVETYLAKKTPSAPLPPSGKVDRVTMSGMRKAIADTITRSYKEVPQAAIVCRVDLTDVLQYIKANKESFLQKEGRKLSVTSFVIYALAQALKDYPLLNSQIDGDTILVKHGVNVGVAVNIEGGLMVPVIKNCHEKGVREIAIDLADLTDKARRGALQPDDVKEGTVTFSNFGMSGMTMGIPIVRYPEVAILGMAGIEKQLVVLDGDRTAVRSMVHLSLSFDHRVVDGMYSCDFLGTLKKYLEKLPEKL